MVLITEGNTMIEIKDCVMRFYDVEAVSGVSIDIPEGSCYGLLGSNGLCPEV